MADVLTQIPQFGFNVPMPMDPDLTPEAINSGLSWMTRQRKQALDDAEAAIRWQGQQDFDRYFKEGKEEGLDDLSASTRAFVKAGPKLFRNDPNTLISLIRATQPKPKVGEPSVIDVEGNRMIKVPNSSGGYSLRAIPTPKPTVEEQAKKAKLSELRSVDRSLALREQEFVPPYTEKVSSGFFGLTSPKTNTVPAEGFTKKDVEVAKAKAEDAKQKRKAIQAEIKALEDELGGKSVTPAAVGETPSQLNPPNIAPEKPAAQSQSASPYPEGTVIRNKRDGKLYKIINGVPVAQE